MRFMLKAEIPVDKGNDAARKGTLGKTIKAILDEQKPEAAYFVESNGTRCAILFLDLEDDAHIPILAEPWFLAFNAKIELKPCMVPEDLAKATAGIAAAVKKFG